MKKPSECPLVFKLLFRGCTANILALMAKEVTASSGPSADTYHLFCYTTIQPFFFLSFIVLACSMLPFFFCLAKNYVVMGCSLSLTSLGSRKDSQNSSDLWKEPPGKSANKHTQVWRDILYVGNQSLLCYLLLEKVSSALNRSIRDTPQEEKSDSECHWGFELECCGLDFTNFRVSTIGMLYYYLKNLLHVYWSECVIGTGGFTLINLSSSQSELWPYMQVYTLCVLKHALLHSQINCSLRLLSLNNILWVVKRGWYSCYSI